MPIDVVAAHGWKVPAPTCSVTKARSTPVSAAPRRYRASKCRPAVGAATAPGFARIDGLVALAIGGLGRAIDIGRQRHRAVRLEELQHVARELQVKQLALAPDHARAVPPGSATAAPAFKPLLARACTSAVSRRQHPLQQQLDPPAAVLDAVNARRDHARVVEHQQIAGAQQRRQIAKLEVPNAPRRRRRAAAAGWRSAASRAAARSAPAADRNESRCAAC